MYVSELIGVLGTAIAGSASPIAIDGDLGEWLPEHVVAVDAEGDASGAFDVTGLSALGLGSELRLRFDTGSLVNLPSGASQDGTLRVELGLPGNALTIDLRARRAYVDGDFLDRIPWLELGFESAPTYASTEFEAVVDLSAYGVAEGTAVTVDFSGSDTLSEPAVITMGPGRAPDTRRDLERLAKTDFRVMSLNTRSSGLGDASRGPRIERIIDAVDADVYCFQEEQTSDAAVASILGRVDPFGDGAAWNVTKRGSNIIASRSPIVEMPEGDSRYVAGVVELPAGPVVFLSIHPNCCGHIGSSEDQARIVQMRRVVETVTALRDGGLGETLEPFADAPVVVIGDYNLVGSRTPLDMLEATPGPGLRRWQLRHVIGDRTVTWRSAGSAFWPGQLDLLTYSAEALLARKGFVLDTADLNAGELGSTGLDAGDSEASDHLTLVADFTVEVDIDDLHEQYLDPIDWNGDGAVDERDNRDLENYLRRNELEEMSAGRR